MKATKGIVGHHGAGPVVRHMRAVRRRQRRKAAMRPERQSRAAQRKATAVQRGYQALVALRERAVEAARERQREAA